MARDSAHIDQIVAASGLRSLSCFGWVCFGLCVNTIPVVLLSVCVPLSSSVCVGFPKTSRGNFLNPCGDSRVWWDIILVPTRDVLSFAFVYPESLPAKSTCVSFWVGTV